MEAKKTILVVEDVFINRCIVKETLKDEYEILEAENGRQALEILGKYSTEISLMLLDLITPEMDGYELLSVLREDEVYRTIPVIVMTANEGDEDEVWCLDHGASDFIRKPYNPDVARQRIRNILGMNDASSERNVLRYDKITGLLTREYFYQEVDEILNNHPDTEYDMICGDVENFSVINAQYGVEKGDELLVYIADSYRKLLGEDVICSRISADNFAVLCEHQSAYLEVLEGPKTDQLRQNAPVPDIVIKYGIYEKVDKSLQTVVIYDRARMALKKNKNNYGVKVARYDEHQSEEMVKRKMLLDSMEDALKNEEFEVYFQPKVNLETETVAGAEALVRWNHPQYGFMSPGEFIPLFETNGFIWQLDQYMEKRVCQELKKMNEQGKLMLPISVNISRRDFEVDDMVDVLCSIIEKYGIDKKYFHIEVTESVYVQNPQKVIEKIRQLRKAGFLIELDDFGEGYSSLEMLSRLPIDVLKLDRSLIQKKNLQQNQTILNFIIGLAECMGIRTVAEGVETEEQAFNLKQIGCDMAQGYYYAKPMPLKRFEEYLVSHSSGFSQKLTKKCELMKVEDHENMTYHCVIEKKKQNLLKADLRFKNEIIKMIDDTISGGLKGSLDDENYTFFFVSDALPRMLGYTYEEFMEVSSGCAAGLVYPPDLPGALKKVEEDFSKGIQYSAKYRVRKKDGSLIWVLDSGQKFVDEHGNYKINSFIAQIDN